MSRSTCLIVRSLGTCTLVLSATIFGLAQSLPFPFQGLLTDNSSVPLNGTYDVQFMLYNNASVGDPVGSTVTLNDIVISGGIVNAELDFGDVFPYQELWIQVGVRPGASGGAYDLITPRTHILWSPRATTAARLGTLVYSNNVPFPGIDFRSLGDMRFHLDDNNNDDSELLSVMDGSDNVLLKLQEVGASADAVVQLYPSSVSPAEMLGEPGLVSVQSVGAVDPTTSVTATVLSATLTLPTAGYVIATVNAVFEMTGGTYTTFGIAQGSTSMPTENDHSYISSGANAWMPVSYSRVFNLTSGAKTFNFLVTEDAGTLIVQLGAKLTLLFIPTSYGTVTTTVAPPIDGEVTAGLTQADIDASRVASIEANQQRIERELAEIRQQMNAVPSEKAVVENRP